MTRTRKSKTTDGVQKSRGKKALSLKDAEDEFVVHQIEDGDDDSNLTSSDASSEGKNFTSIFKESTILNEEPNVAEKVKVKFSNFVQLVANHNYEEVIEKNKDEDVIISSDVLADLANAHEQEEERRIPAIFIIGVILGIVITYILLRY
jgi:hypothetical protein